MAGKRIAGETAIQDKVFDIRAFRNCLGQYGTGVTVITTEHEGVRAGIAANSFSSLSLDPPLVLWSIGHASRSFPVFRETDHFAVNVLSSGQVEVAKVFSSKAEDKFAPFCWTSGIGKSPLLGGALATFECSVEARQEAGDHMLFIGRVLRFANSEGNPLLFTQGNYGIAAEHPELSVRQLGSAGHIPELQYLSLWHLIFFAQNALSENFEEHRRAVGISLNHSRIITLLSHDRGMTRRELSKRVFMSPDVMNNSISELLEQQRITEDGHGLLYLTESGRERREAILNRLVEFEAEQLEGSTEAEIVGARSLLSRIVNRSFSDGSSAS